jgi:hypothetical protein
MNWHIENSINILIAFEILSIDKHVCVAGHITKKEEKLTREEDVDYRASFNGAQVPEITDWPSLHLVFWNN